MKVKENFQTQNLAHNWSWGGASPSSNTHNTNFNRIEINKRTLY